MPKKVEEKIRYLLRKFPSTEWSGILFYKHSGSFENEDLEIYCEDIYPMDLGSGTFTDFKMDESVVGYIAENIDLFSCEMGLVHSHHHMGAFFSGTDTATLRSEGADTNCFVSLIVDTKGTYQAAITRRVQKTTEVVTKNLASSYKFFGEGEIKTDEDPMSESTKVIDSDVIEYFMLDVEREVVDNPLSFLDTRFDEIQDRKKEQKPSTTWPALIDELPLQKNRHSNYSQQYLFPKEEMEELETIWEPDPTIIHHLLCQMILCSLNLKTEGVDLKQWIVRYMDKKYAEIFGDVDSLLFEDWKEFIIEFLVSQYPDTDVPVEVFEDYDNFQSLIASAMMEQLKDYPSNRYIEKYEKTLNRYIYE